MLKDYEISVKTKEGVVYRTIKGYQSARAAMNVVVSELTSKGGVFSDSGELFIPGYRIIDIEVTNVR